MNLWLLPYHLAHGSCRHPLPRQQSPCGSTSTQLAVIYLEGILAWAGPCSGFPWFSIFLKNLLQSCTSLHSVSHLWLLLFSFTHMDVAFALWLDDTPPAGHPSLARRPAKPREGPQDSRWGLLLLSQSPLPPSSHQSGCTEVFVQHPPHFCSCSSALTSFEPSE